MGTKTGISWTDATWNPIRGCSRVSEGCRHCYAERVAFRFSGEGQPYEGLVQVKKDNEGLAERLPLWNGKIKFVEEHLLDPLRWKKPRRIFVNSMSDLFHENVTDEMLDRIFAVMALSHQHTFQVLTKRPERMLEYFAPDKGVWLRVSEVCDAMGYPVAGGWPLRNVQLGVSVEDQKTADLRIPLLLQTPAAVRFLSCEPLLDSVSLARWTDEGIECGCGWFGLEGDAKEAGPDDDLGFECPKCGDMCMHTPLDERLGDGIDWVIVGGESGPGARPMHPEWARSLRDQCKDAGVPFFFKQWGEWLPDNQNTGMDKNLQHSPTAAIKVGTKAAGCLLDGIEHHEFPAVTA